MLLVKQTPLLVCFTPLLLLEGDAAESKPVGFISVTLGVETATIHVQVVRATITVGCGRPPVPVGVLAVQVTIAPVVVAREHIRKRIPTGYL